MRLAWKLNLGQLTAYAGKIALLLKRGASSQASNQHGNTVLHITIECFARSGAATYKKDELHYALTSVIGAGADVTARNKAGYTVSGYAYLWGLGAQWENALRESGNDVSKSDDYEKLLECPQLINFRPVTHSYAPGCQIGNLSGQSPVTVPGG
ncbi:hypothetical protein BDD12DRAFT_880695 [Trichophaea hybrida]|nr:hypothetical protein BDD12DRAFT_880695 [Trichophaea hybrida]